MKYAAGLKTVLTSDNKTIAESNLGTGRVADRKGWPSCENSDVGGWLVATLIENRPIFEMTTGIVVTY